MGKIINAWPSPSGTRCVLFTCINRSSCCKGLHVFHVFKLTTNLLNKLWLVQHFLQREGKLILSQTLIIDCLDCTFWTRGSNSRTNTTNGAIWFNIKFGQETTSITTVVCSVVVCLAWDKIYQKAVCNEHDEAANQIWTKSATQIHSFADNECTIVVRPSLQIKTTIPGSQQQSRSIPIYIHRER